jgi:hypothetical protein
MMFRRICLSGLTLLAAWVADARTLLACPDCALGRQVRSGLIDDRFWPFLGAVVAPVLVIGAIAAALQRVGSGELKWKTDRTADR